MRERPSGPGVPLALASGHCVANPRGIDELLARPSASITLPVSPFATFAPMSRAIPMPEAGYRRFMAATSAALSPALFNSCSNATRESRVYAMADASVADWGAMCPGTITCLARRERLAAT